MLYTVPHTQNTTKMKEQNISVLFYLHPCVVRGLPQFASIYLIPKYPSDSDFSILTEIENKEQLSISRNVRSIFVFGFRWVITSKIVDKPNGIVH